VSKEPSIGFKASSSRRGAMPPSAVLSVGLLDMARRLCNFSNGNRTDMPPKIETLEDYESTGIYAMAGSYIHVSTMLFMRRKYRYVAPLVICFVIVFFVIVSNPSPGVCSAKKKSGNVHLTGSSTMLTYYPMFSELPAKLFVRVLEERGNRTVNCKN
jgi:hypothetical protein